MDQGISYLILKMFTVMCFFQAERRVLINDQQQAISLYTQFLAAAIHRLFKQHARIVSKTQNTSLLWKIREALKSHYFIFIIL